MADNMIPDRFGESQPIGAIMLVEPRWWSQALGVTEEQLRAALQAADGKVIGITKYLPK